MAKKLTARRRAVLECASALKLNEALIVRGHDIHAAAWLDSKHMGTIFRDQVGDWLFKINDAGRSALADEEGGK